MRKSLVFAIIMVICSVTSCLHKVSENNDCVSNTFQNPILSSGHNPQAIFYKGKYYYTHETNDRILLWEADDITDMGNSLCKEVWRPKEDVGRHNLWAPEIHRINNKWYIYYAADDGNTDNHQIFVLENAAETPMTGEFKQKGPIISNIDWNWGIHASTFVHNNTQYLIWSGWSQRRVMEETQCIYIASMKNPWTLSSERVMISEPTFSWERQWINPDGSRTAYPIYVNEAPYFIKSLNGDKLFILYSASGCWTPYYCVGLLHCDADADLLAPVSWVKEKEPVFSLSMNDSVWGPGGASFVPSPDSSEWYVLYHARNLPNGVIGSGELRSPRIQKISWDERGFPVLGTPVSLNKRMQKPSNKSKQD